MTTPTGTLTPDVPRNTGLCGDAIEELRALPDNSIDACITDPPYGLGEVKDLPALLMAWMAGEDGAAHVGKGGFMAKAWDRSVPPPILWREVYRVMKPGAYLLCFAGTRTWDLMSLSIRLAGFEDRDTIGHHYSGFSAAQWEYGEGFPKSLNLGNGQGTALKPAWEPILMFRKPLDGTVAHNVTAWGTGSVNIDATRIDSGNRPLKIKSGKYEDAETYQVYAGARGSGWSAGETSQGRWPTNVLYSHSLFCIDNQCMPDCPVAHLEAQSGELTSGAGGMRHKIGTGYRGSTYGAESRAEGTPVLTYGDTGTAARFFPQFRYADDDAFFRYIAKASRAEREEGCSLLPHRTAAETVDRAPDSAGIQSPRAGAGRTSGARNHHPTVKPVALMQWLIRLVTVPGQVVLDPFGGSGTTGVAAVREGRDFILIERDEAYWAICDARIRYAQGLWRTEAA